MAIFVLLTGGNYATNGGENIREELIEVALYKCKATTNIFTNLCFQYAWYANKTLYKFNLTEIGAKEILGKGNHPLNNENYDVLIIGASAKSYFLDGMNSGWRKSITKFIANGGGYIGICGGAIAASQGYEKPKSPLQKKANKGVLGIADIYINDDFDGEWQYLLKMAAPKMGYSGQIPVKVVILKNNSIFEGYDKSNINISYGGGPGIYKADVDDPMLGNIEPLMLYNEELMYTKPIHYWKPTINGWKIAGNVSTDIMNQYAAIITNYGNGKVILFGPHPEEPPMLKGRINEFFGKSAWDGYRYVYEWVNGNYTKLSHTWWILRRSAALAGGIDKENLPPISYLSCAIEKPPEKWEKNVYVNNRQINLTIAKEIASMVGRSIIIGNFTMKVISENAERVEFYIDDSLQYTANEPFYSFNNWTFYKWNIDKKLTGFHNIKAKAYDAEGNFAWDEADVLFLW